MPYVFVIDDDGSAIAMVGSEQEAEEFERHWRDRRDKIRSGAIDVEQELAGYKSSLDDWFAEEATT